MLKTKGEEKCVNKCASIHSTKNKPLSIKQTHIYVIKYVYVYPFIKP